MGLGTEQPLFLLKSLAVQCSGETDGPQGVGWTCHVKGQGFFKGLLCGRYGSVWSPEEAGICQMPAGPG